MIDFIKRYTGRIDFVIYSVVGSIIVGFILLDLANIEAFNVNGLIGLIIGQLFLIGFSLFIKRTFMNDSNSRSSQ